MSDTDKDLLNEATTIVDNIIERALSDLLVEANANDFDKQWMYEQFKSRLGAVYEKYNKQLDED